MTDKTCLSYWFPRLVEAGIPVPETVVIDIGEQWIELLKVLDGKTIPPLFDELVARIREAAQKDEIGGYPIFLRTGHGSGKHQWLDTCYVTDPGSIMQHVCNLIEWSECVDMLGLPYRVWAVRMFLQLDHKFLAFNGMPIASEWRCFVSGGDVICEHPYWPIETLEGHVTGAFSYDREKYTLIETDSSWREQHASMFAGPTPDEALDLMYHVASVFRDDGSWSVDVCKTANGHWFVTDMAEAEKSYHFPGCAAEKTAPWVKPT